MDRKIVNQALFVTTKDQLQDNLYIQLGEQLYYQLQKLLDQGKINAFDFFLIIENSKNEQITQQTLETLLLGKLKYSRKHIKETRMLKDMAKQKITQEISKKIQRILPKLTYDHKPAPQKNIQSLQQTQQFKKNQNKSYFTCYYCNEKFCDLDQLTAHRQNCR